MRTLVLVRMRMINRSIGYLQHSSKNFSAGRRGRNEPRLLMAATCVGAVVDDERLWRDCLRNCFGRSGPLLQSRQLSYMTTSRVCHVVSSQLYYIRPDARALQQFLHSLSRHSVALPYHELAILSINQDVFLTHVPTLTKISGRAIQFVNISDAQR